MVKVKVLKKYFDKELDKFQKKGTVFEADEERADVLEKAGVAKIVKEKFEQKEADKK